MIEGLLLAARRRRTRPRSVARDAHHACAVSGDGRVACWGIDTSGEIGSDALGFAERVPANPVWVAGIDDAERTALGGDTSCVLRRDGRASSWGSNERALLGWVKKKEFREPVVVNGLADIRAIAATSFETFALSGDGSGQAWGGYEPAKGPRASTLARTTSPSIRCVCWQPRRPR